jgi:hypothetical protein
VALGEEKIEGRANITLGILIAERYIKNATRALIHIRTQRI